MKLGVLVLVLSAVFAGLAAADDYKYQVDWQSYYLQNGASHYGYPSNNGDWQSYYLQKGQNWSDYYGYSGDWRQYYGVGARDGQESGNTTIYSGRYASSFYQPCMQCPGGRNWLVPRQYVRRSPIWFSLDGRPQHSTVFFFGRTK